MMILNKIKIWDILYYALIVFFSYTTATKFLNISSFQTNIFKTGLFSEEMVKIISYLVVAVESIVVILLILKKKIGLFLSVAMMTAFTIYIIVLWTQNRYEICGCGGVLNGLSFKYHLIINLIIISSAYHTLKHSLQNEE